MEFKEGDIIIYDTSFNGADDIHTPLWGGEYGNVKGTVISINDERYIHKFSRPDSDFPLKVIWDNGEVNGYKPTWFSCFKIIKQCSKQLKLF